ncbi:MAG: bifunctional ornithine acetyltransferase/N-acetylglutamate synthase, partial [Proteobacteria bacterium]|nr:bifunctional ornithine acetyltransferase/N-acetylglutamate synthase [Pseudomonadota bacterium]
KNEDLYEVIRNAIEKVAVKLAKMIIKDGEGATKFVTIKVKTGQDEKECRAVAFSIAESPLVKTAFYAEDPNLGRILAAIGKSDVKKLNLQNIIIHLDSMVIFENGERAVGYDEKKASTIMKKDEFCLIINLARGEEEFELWTCDMSHDYVTINSDYRS